MGVLAGFVVYFISGALWFGPKTFYPAWMRAKGHDPANQPGSHGMAPVFGMTVLGALVHVIALASVLWFVAEAQGSVGPLGGDGFTVWAIEVGGDIVGLTLAGLVVGLIG